MVDRRLYGTLPRLLPHQQIELYRLHRFSRNLVRPHVRLAHLSLYTLN